MNAQSGVGETAISTERLIALELRRAVAREADSLTELAQQVLKEIGDTELPNNQINGVLAIANTADKVADITRFLEKQGSRRERWQRYSERLLMLIRGNLLDRAKTVAREVAEQVHDYHQRSAEDDKPQVDALSDQRKRLPEVHLLLVREFVQSFGIGYLYNFSKERS
jgi:hypothetical protein